jgi:hypothetical protein
LFFQPEKTATVAGSHQPSSILRFRGEEVSRELAGR